MAPTYNMPRIGSLLRGERKTLFNFRSSARARTLNTSAWLPSQAKGRVRSQSGKASSTTPRSILVQGTGGPRRSGTLLLGRVSRRPTINCGTLWELHATERTSYWFKYESITNGWVSPTSSLCTDRVFRDIYLVGRWTGVFICQHVVD